MFIIYREGRSLKCFQKFATETFESFNRWKMWQIFDAIVICGSELTTVH